MGFGGDLEILGRDREMDVTGRVTASGGCGGCSEGFGGHKWHRV